MKKLLYLLGVFCLLALGAGLAIIILPRGWASSAQDKKNPSAKVVDASQYKTLQEAINAIPAKGGLLLIPPGTYEISKPLVLSREDIRIEGTGTATHLVNKSAKGEPALILRPGDFEKNPKSRIWRVQVSNLRISGNPKSGDGILAEGINEILVQGISIDHNGGHGINLVDCYEDPRICNSILTYNGKAGLNILRGHDIVVSGNQFEENQDALRCVDSFNLCMIGNNLDDHLRHGVVIENTYGSVVSGNMIEECKGTALILDRDCYGITISANVIAHNFGGGVNLKDAWGCAISANTFTIVEKEAINVGPGSGRITITGNNFSNSFIGGKQMRGKEDLATGILLRDTSHIAISGNVFTGLAGPALRTIGKCPLVNVTGNVMADLNRRAQGGNSSAIVLTHPDQVDRHGNSIEKTNPKPKQP